MITMIMLITALSLSLESAPREKRKLEYTVTPQWMADYWLLEAAWAYPIPDDDLIRYENGNYIVPVVVYRHYEDMLKAKELAARDDAARK